MEGLKIEMYIICTDFMWYGFIYMYMLNCKYNLEVKLKNKKFIINMN